MLKIVKLPKNSNPQEIAQELQSSKWETLRFDASENSVANFLSSDLNYLFLAYLNGKVVGMLVAHELHKLDTRFSEFLLYEIEVKSEHRNQGIGHALIEELIKTAKVKRANEIWVLTEKNNLEANKLYNSFTNDKPSQELMYTLNPN